MSHKTATCKRQHFAMLLRSTPIYERLARGAVTSAIVNPSCARWQPKEHQSDGRQKSDTIHWTHDGMNT
jgi:hypothetical protein